MTTEKINFDTLTLDERMQKTLTYVKNTLYNTGLCQKLYTYLVHAEKLRTENAETNMRTLYDALDLFIDFMKRAKKKSLNMEDISFVYSQITEALRNPESELALA